MVDICNHVRFCDPATTVNPNPKNRARARRVGKK